MQTALLGGDQTATVTFTSDAVGTSTFVCDVHPAEMIGTLTVT